MVSADGTASPTWGREVSTSSPSLAKRMSAAARWERRASAALMGPLACPPHGVRGACCPMSPSTDLHGTSLGLPTPFKAAPGKWADEACCL